MNIISRIKSWFEPKQQPKVRIRFKNGRIVNIYYNHTDDARWLSMFNQWLACYQMKIDKTNGINRNLGGLGCSYW